MTCVGSAGEEKAAPSSAVTTGTDTSDCGGGIPNTARIDEGKGGSEPRTQYTDAAIGGMPWCSCSYACMRVVLAGTRTCSKTY